MIGKHVYAVAFGFCAFLVHLIVCQKFRPQYSYNSGNAQNLPNPAINVTECQMSGPSRICDLYGNLTASREGLNDALRNLEGLKPGDALGSATECLCNRECKQPTVIMVALHLREIGPDLTDPRVEAEAMAKKLRDSWRLSNCSVVFFSSIQNRMSYSLAGIEVNQLLTENKTKEIDEYVHQTYGSKDLFEEAINKTVNLYSQALAESVQASTPLPPTPSPPSPWSTTCVIIIVVVVLVVVVVVVGLVLYLIKRKKQKQSMERKKKEGEPMVNPKT